MADDTDPVYFLQEEELEEPVYGDAGTQLYEEVNIEDFLSSEDEGDENLEVALKLIGQSDKSKLRPAHDRVAPTNAKDVSAKVIEWPEVVEDFVRNYLVKMGMLATLDCFQVEWYRLKESGQLQDQSNSTLPDVYHQNRQLIKQLELQREDVIKHREAAQNAKSQFVKLKKERDHHRMNHRRVLQEKERVLKDMKRLKDLLAHHTDVLEDTKNKFENAAREKTIAQVENERLRLTCKMLRSTKRTSSAQMLREEKGEGGPVLEVLGSDKDSTVTTGREDSCDGDSNKPSQASMPGLAGKEPSSSVKSSPQQDPPGPALPSKPSGRGGGGPVSERAGLTIPAAMANPYQCMKAPQSTHLSREDGWTASQAVQTHTCAVSGLCLHPRKLAFVTGSDDHDWKMWSLPECEVLMSGSGHKDWVGAVQISPNGCMLASSSGDGAVKLWDFRKGVCVCTLQDHKQPVWESSWHSKGDYLATASMDHTVKLWDVHKEQCVGTFRGHADSVNSAEFLVYSNTLCTSSADKTVSLWDIRAGLCVQTFFGHNNSCNGATATLKGDIIASCDSFGHVFLWDVRGSSALLARDLGPHSTNKAAFDPCGELVGLASSDGTVKIMNILTSQVDELRGHEDKVQSVVFSMDGSFALSSDSDGRVILWN